MSALFPPSTGAESVPFTAFLGGITAYGSYTKRGQLGGRGFPSLYALGFLVQQIMGGRLMFLHRTGSGRSALDGVGTHETKRAIVIAKTQGKTSRSPRDIYTHLTSCTSISTDARLAGAA